MRRRRRGGRRASSSSTTTPCWPATPAPTACTSARTTAPSRGRARCIGPAASSAAPRAAARRWQRAAAEGADYASVAPVWETATHPTRPRGRPRRVAAAARDTRLPWFALGGIDERRILRVARARRAPRRRGPRRHRGRRPGRGRAPPARGLLDARPRVMTVAGSDSGGGAGIQADIKAISRAGGFPLVAVTALTAQTTTRRARRRSGRRRPSSATRSASVRRDIGLDGVKTGHAGHAGDGCGRRRRAGRRSTPPTRCRSSSTR